MIKMKLTAAAISLALIGATAAGAQVLKMGVEGAYPPFNSIDSNGDVTGFDVDIGNELCERMNRDCEWVTQQWDGMIPALKTGKFDVMVSSMTITDERAEQVLFTDPYYFSYAMMATFAGSDLSLDSDSLAGKTIGLQAGTNHERWLPEKYGDGFEVRAYPSTDDMFLDFENGRLDAIFADAAIVDPWITENGGDEVYIQVGDKVNDPDLGTDIGIAVRKDDEALAEELNTAIAAIVDDGTFDTIANKYFDIKMR